MAPEEYLRQYAESFLPPKVESDPSLDGTDLTLERGYYYPPYLKQEAYLDTLSRADLLEIVEKLLATEYPQQRLVRRQVGEYLEAMQRLRSEREWRQAEMERLNGELVWRVDELAKLENLLIDSHAELENSRSQIAILQNERAILNAMLTDLQTSTSWKVTAPLRFISGKIRKSL